MHFPFDADVPGGTEGNGCHFGHAGFIGSNVPDESGRDAVPLNNPKPSIWEPRRFRILLVDDHKDSRVTMRLILKMFGYAVECADSVETGYLALTSAQYDLVISDIGLPDGTGHDLIRKVKESGIEIKAVALSAFVYEDDVKRSLDAGFLNHWAKPLGLEEFSKNVEEVLRT